MTETNVKDYPARTPPKWSKTKFASWLQRMGWDWSEAAKALGMSKRQVRDFCEGRAKVRGVVALACMELEHDRAQAAKQ